MHHRSMAAPHIEPAHRSPRLKIRRAPARATLDLAGDVRQGLSRNPKTLPCKYFYDRRGSELFEQICRLEEYYLPRAEGGILASRAGEIAAACSPGLSLIELGSGNSAKTRLLIEALLRREGRLHYVPIDISEDFLHDSAARLLQHYDGLHVTAFAGDYAAGLEYVQREVGGPRLLLWLGSSIGNLERGEAAAFLAGIRAAMKPADALLVGIDLRKDEAVLLQAYDDTAGVTAEFNRNILRRINRELEAGFVVDAFRHRAIYDETAGRVEIALVAERAQTVRIGLLNMTVTLRAGEAIHTEHCYKYSTGEIQHLGRRAGLELARQWLDPEERFSLNLFRSRHDPLG